MNNHDQQDQLDLLDNPIGFQVEYVDVSAIKPNPDNPRGVVQRDDSFQRLADSIARVGLLVPVVLRQLKDSDSYELVDGERRYWACQAVGLLKLPAHILTGNVTPQTVRKLMFHLHMTREQWGALAQCHSLDEAYPDLEPGLKFEEKARWIRRLVEDTGMSSQTAKDRINVLSWPGPLKQRIYAFNASLPNKDIYSYVLAIEVSIVEPSRQYFRDYYNHGRETETANEVRTTLYEKTESGLTTGTITSREQIRYVKSLFDKRLDHHQRALALHVFKRLVSDQDVGFNEVRTEIEAAIPQLAAEPAPSPKRLATQIKALEQKLRNYESEIIEASTDSPAAKEAAHALLVEALESLIEVAEALAVSLRA